MELPLLRIDADFVTRKVRRFTILSWLIELWFLEEAFCQVQEAGTIPYDEPFCYFSILTDSIQELQQGEITFPYDLSAPSRAFINKCHEQNMCKDFIPSMYAIEDMHDYAIGVALVRITDQKVLVGKARCRLFRFMPVAPWELCQELAAVAVGEKLKAYIAGKAEPWTMEQAKASREWRS